MIARAGVEYENPDSTGQARERPRQVALFVAREDDGGD
jgi:hypothetical protein